MNPVPCAVLLGKRLIVALCLRLFVVQLFRPPAICGAVIEGPSTSGLKSRRSPG
jgi:hypothetical protein